MGAHLRKLLPSPQYEVFGTAFPEMPQERRGPSGEEIFSLDVRSEKDVYDSVKSIKPHWIFHLAAISNVKHSWEKRKDTLETNLMGTCYLLEAVRQFAPKARILFVSSSDVYREMMPEGEALREEAPLQPVNPYAYTKIGGEMLSGFYFRIEKTDVVIARSFPHTGPGQSAHFVCSDWASQIARIEKGLQEPVIRVGNCNVRRDFSDVRDVVKAYFLLMQKGKSGDVYNVCSGRAVMLKEILDLLLSFSSAKIEVEVDQQRLRKAEISLLVGDNGKIKEATSWAPKILLEKSLRDLLKYWHDNI